MNARGCESIHGSFVLGLSIVFAGLAICDGSFAEIAGPDSTNCEHDASSLMQGANLVHGHEILAKQGVSRRALPETSQASLGKPISSDSWCARGLAFLLENADAIQSRVPGLDAGDKWALLSMTGLMGSALCLDFLQVQALYLVVVTTLWAVASLAMQIVNKLALSVIPLPMTLLIAQMLIAIALLFVLCGPRRLFQEIREHSDACARWSALSAFFGLGLITSLLALGTGSVTLITVVRNLMPLISLFAERSILPAGSTRIITCEAVLALATLAGGTALYAVSDLQVSGSWKALVYIFMNMFALVAYRLIERKLLLEIPRSLSFGTLSLLQNLSGILLVLIFFFAWGEHRAVWEHPHLYSLAHWRDPFSFISVLFSGCAGLALGYYSVKLQKEITATTFLAIQSTCKVFTILVAMLVLGERLGTLTAAGCIISLGGVAWYGYVVIREDVQAKKAQDTQIKDTQVKG